MGAQRVFAVAIALASLGLVACSDDAGGDAGKSDAAVDAGGGGKGGGGDGILATFKDDCDVVVSEADCDKSKRPFVFVHGTYGSGQDFSQVAMLLGSNGYCQDRIVGVEYNSLGDMPGSDGAIDAAVDAVLAKFPDFDQVDLAGHSQGTRHCGVYLSEPARAAKVAHYINFSGVPAVGDVATLSLSSKRDLGNSPHHATGNNVTSVTFEDEDHFAVAASRNAFIEVYKYLNDGKEPKYKEVQCGDEMVTIEGISETFAVNVPITGELSIRELGADPREPGAIVKLDMTSSTDGHFGPIKLKRNVPYEFSGRNNQGVQTGYMYYAPWKRSNYLVRLLLPASADDGVASGLVAANSTDYIKRGPNHSAIMARWSGGGFRQDLGASLTINGEEVLTGENSGESALASMNLGGGTVGLFLYDDNGNGATDHGLVASASFLAFSDVFLDAKEPGWLELDFTPGSEDPNVKGIRVVAPNWPSENLLIGVVLQ